MRNETIFSTKIISGQGALTSLEQYRSERFLIVTDNYLKESSGFARLLAIIGKNNQYTVFDQVLPDPPIKTISTGVGMLQESQATVILGVGGGSVIDVAKGIKFVAEKLNNQQELRLIAVPSTSGSGSEVTNFSIITDEVSTIKYPIVSDSIQPNEAILDVDFVMTMPQEVTADTGMDVLTHILEAYVSTKASDFSDALCEKAIVLLCRYLPLAYKNGDDVQARQKVHYASCMAGMAFNTTSLGVNHSLAHAAGAKLHIPHGRLNTILMPQVIQYNSGLLVKKGEAHANILKKYAELAARLDLSGSNDRLSVKNLLRKIDQLRQQLNLPKGFREYGLPKAVLVEYEKVIVEAAMTDPCTLTNPVIPNSDELSQLLWLSY
ncbi:iron-containing alcohol dehydrogenase [Vagococcus sp. BWB3-3]|uniref:Iron-containing alcohol dehydrogenase n=1 Tax=Vagococcus allomyrinae TaxID=2794353 RepID=A0A940SQB0_9ENTE|nr:iron-containing alcohol dehydrogenase [Vagococcus allomyrinae]